MGLLDRWNRRRKGKRVESLELRCTQLTRSNHRAMSDLKREIEGLTDLVDATRKETEETVGPARQVLIVRLRAHENNIRLRSVRLNQYADNMAQLQVASERLAQGGAGDLGLSEPEVDQVIRFVEQVAERMERNFDGHQDLVDLKLKTDSKYAFEIESAVIDSEARSGSSKQAILDGAAAADDESQEQLEHEDLSLNTRRHPTSDER